MAGTNVHLADYLLAVSHAAARFQYLEEILKMYLADCFQIVKLSVKRRVAFDFSYDDVKVLPLGRLIDLFQKYNRNPEVLELLRELPEQRNYVAHRAYLLTEEEQKNSEVLANEMEKVTKISAKADEAVKALRDEARNLERLRMEIEREDDTT